MKKSIASTTIGVSYARQSKGLSRLLENRLWTKFFLGILFLSFAGYLLWKNPDNRPWPLLSGIGTSCAVGLAFIFSSQKDWNQPTDVVEICPIAGLACRIASGVKLLRGQFCGKITIHNIFEGLGTPTRDEMLVNISCDKNPKGNSEGDVVHVSGGSPKIVAIVAKAVDLMWGKRKVTITTSILSDED